MAVMKVVMRVDSSWYVMTVLIDGWLDGPDEG